MATVHKDHKFIFVLQMSFDCIQVTNRACGGDEEYNEVLGGLAVTGDAAMMEAASKLEIVILDVSFDQRAVVKSLGGRWNKEISKWYIDVAAATDMRLQPFWTLQFQILCPYVRRVQRARDMQQAALYAIDAGITYPLSFASDFYRMMELHPESTYETAGVPANVHLRVSPADMKSYVHKRCDRPVWTSSDCALLQKKMTDNRDVINASFGLEADNKTSLGLQTVPAPYFWGVKLRNGVLEDKPSGIGIRVLF